MSAQAVYALVAAAIFALEVLIALFVKDDLVRPYVGDVLAVALVYAALRAVTQLGVIPAISIALLIATAVEVAQLLNLLGALGLNSNRVARIVLGGAFDWLDFAAYLTGAALVMVVEALRKRMR